LIPFYHDEHAPAQPDQFAPEFTELLDIYRALKPRSVLEIGVSKGGTLYQWIKYAGKRAKIMAIDLPGGPWGVAGEPPLEDWLGWATDRDVSLMVLLGSSHAPDMAWTIKENGPYDFVFIDGDHSYLGMACDFLTYSPLVRKGGLIVLHDIVKDQSDVKIEGWRYWQEIKAACRTTELLSDPGQTSRGLGVVYV
jgi:cephalosporin hydroxylase